MLLHQWVLGVFFGICLICCCFVIFWSLDFGFPASIFPRVFQMVALVAGIFRRVFEILFAFGGSLASLVGMLGQTLPAVTSRLRLQRLPEHKANHVASER